MQHSCRVTHSIALSYQFQNTTISIRPTLNIVLYEVIKSNGHNNMGIISSYSLVNA